MDHGAKGWPQIRLQLGALQLITIEVTYELLFGNIGSAFFAVRHAEVDTFGMNTVLAHFTSGRTLVLEDSFPTDVAKFPFQMAVVPTVRNGILSGKEERSRV